MPTYEYACPDCGRVKELIRSYSQLHDPVYCWECRENWEQAAEMNLIPSRFNPLWMDQIVTSARKICAEGDEANKAVRNDTFWAETDKRQKADRKHKKDTELANDTNWKEKSFYPGGKKSKGKV